MKKEICGLSGIHLVKQRLTINKTNPCIEQNTIFFLAAN